MVDELFPPTESEKLEVVRAHILDEVERREKSAGTALEKLAEARDNLSRVERAITVLAKAEESVDLNSGEVLTTATT